MSRDRDELLRAARDELYHARVLTRSLRNRLKVDAAALFDSEQRTEALIAEIDIRLTGSLGPKEAHGHDREAHLSQTR